MAPKQTYPIRNYEVGQYLVTLRSRAKLTQSELAARISLHRRSVQKWESGETYPTAENLRALIAVLLPLGAFTPGQEQAEAADLWQRVSADAPQQLPLFDTVWLDQLLAVRTVAGLADPQMATRDIASASTGAASPAADRQRAQGEQHVAFNLPLPPTPLIGRAAELTEIARILSDPACHLLTLLGPGGIGKTRLALEAVTNQTNVFSDGVVFVALTAAGTPNQMVLALGEALNLSFAGQSDPTTHLVDYLRQRHILLVLDDFEHLLEGADLVAHLLQAALHITILVTSRARLNLQAEWLFDVEGLSYPSADSYSRSAAPNLADLAEDYGAVQLFVQRATQVQPGFPLSEAALTAIVHICQHVAGMPLAIELAAAGVRLLSISEIERQIRSNLDVLATTLRDVPLRHRSMRAVFDQSWDLLSEPERALFSRLAIFRGSCTLAAAGQVAHATLPVLAGLIDKSLVRQGSAEQRAVTNAVAEPRLVLLEPIREYALEQLAARGELEALQQAHAGYYLALAEVAAAQSDSATVDMAIKQLNREHNNIRAALQWARDGGHSTIGLQLAGALWRFWRASGISEGRIWLEELLALAEGANPDTTALAARLRATNVAAWLASDQNDFVHAAQLFEQNMALRPALMETESEPNLLVNAARQARSVGQYWRATTLLEDALAQHRAAGNRGSVSSAGLGLSLYELALVLREQGDFARSAAIYEECVQLHRELGDREGMAQGLLGLGDLARDQGDVAGVRRYCEESLAIFREFGVQWAIGFSLNNLALAAYQAGDLPQALALVSESAAIFRDQKADASLAEVLISLGHILLAQGDGAAAHQALTQALGLAWMVGPRLLVAPALEGLAGLAVQPGQVALAARLLGAALALRIRLGTPLWPANQPAVERVMATARSTLGSDAFATVWAAAGEMSLEQILSTIPDAVSFSAGAAPFTAPPEAAEALPVTARLRRHGMGRVDWGLAQDVPALYGRADELATLTHWAIAEQCRVITLAGIGGIGKTSLAITFARQAAPDFETVVFRSLGEAPPFSELLDQLIYSVAAQQIVVPVQVADKLALLIELLRQGRCLLILDNLETLMQVGTTEAHYLAGYEAYGTLFQYVGEMAHQSCLILTSRERPPELGPLEGPRSPVRTMRVTGLPEDACRVLLAEQDLTGTAGDAAALARRYGGNPLALKLVAEPIRALFSGDIAAFLTEGTLFFDSVAQLLEQQISRASALEQALLTWLAIVREPVALDQLMRDLTGSASRTVVLAALHALWRRNLIERGQVNLTFTLQRVVLEYLTEHLVEQAADEIRQGSFDYLLRHTLIQATAKDYVRRSQELLIATPLLEQLLVTYGGAAMLERQLLALLAAWRDQPQIEQGYGPSNIIHLLRLLRGHLRSLDLAHLTLRQAYLQGVEAQDTNLAGAMVQDSVFTETFDAMIAVAVSSSGEYWAASSRRGEVRVWTASGLNLRRAWRAHADMVWTLAFSPDGHTLASGSWDGTVKLWDIASGALLWVGQHSGHVNCIAFAPDGSMLASSGNDATIRLWDSRSGTQLQTLSHPNLVIPLAWSLDGHLLASGDVEGCIHLWEMQQTGPAICVQTLTGHTNYVDGLAFAPGGGTLASGSWDGTVKLWEMPGGLLRQTLAGHTDRVSRVAWSPDGRTLASSSRDQTIWLWDATQGSYRATLQGHTAGVCGMAFTPDSRSLLSGSEDGTLRVWDVPVGQCMRVIQGYAASLYDVDWSPDGSQLVSGGSDTLVTLYTVTDGTPSRVLRGHSGIVFKVGWSATGRWLASSEWDNSIRLWDPTSGACLEVLRHPDDTGNFFYGLAWSPDGQRLASGTYKRGIQVFEMASQRHRWEQPQFPTWIGPVAWSPDEAQLAGGGDDGTVYVWDTAENTLLQRLVGHHSMITSAAWSPTGTRLASGGSGNDGGELFVWDVQRGERVGVFAGHPGIVYAVAWGPNEDLLISGGGDGTLRWWDMQSGECVRVREAHQGTVQSLRRSPDGTKLASCGHDGAIMLWNLRSGEYLQTLRRDRPYERLNISGIKGLTEAQRTAFRALGAVES